jgi:hypothetical protein
MPLEDSAVVVDGATAYRYSGGAPSLLPVKTPDGFAYGDVFGVDFPLAGMSPRLPVAADAGGLAHFLEGGKTALRLEDGKSYLLNPTREFVVPGGSAMPTGSVLFKIGPNGTRIPIRKW